ncbi:hypothetical protein ABFV05_011553 [Capra hircus]
MYNFWTWKLRSHVQRLQDQLINQIQNGKIQTLKTYTLEAPVTEIYEAIKQKLEKYFNEDPDSEVLVQCKGNFENKLITLKEALILDVQRKAKEQEKLDNKKSGYEKELLEKSQNLAFLLNDTKLSEEELHEKFNPFWEKWVYDVSSSTHSQSQLLAELPSAGSYDNCRSTRETVGLLTPHQGAPGSRANQQRSKDQTPPVSPPPDEVNAPSPPSPRLPTRQALIHMRKHVHHAELAYGIVRHERIEASWARVDELRGYAEKLIDYGKLGDTNERALRMADFWLTEKDLIPKLFQVLAPRYQGQNGGYTRMLQIPNRNQQDRAEMAVIEYKGNCLPPLPLPLRDSNVTLLNQLLQGLRQDQEASTLSSHPAQTPEV